MSSSEAVQSLKSLKDSISSVTSEWKANQAEARMAGDRVQAAREKYQGLTEVIGKQSEYLKRLEQNQQELRDAQSKVDQSTKQGQAAYESYEQQIAKAGRSIASATTKLSSLKSQQDKAKNSLNYYESGLAKAQTELKQISSSTSAYVERLRAEGKENEANKAQLKGLQSEYSKLSNIYKTQNNELQKIADSAGKSSDAYRNQEIRVNKTATSLAKAKTQMGELDSAMHKANPSIFDRIKSKIHGVNGEAEKTHHTFKEVFMGSALGTGLTNLMSNIGSQFKSIYKDGMDFNSVQGKINARFQGMKLGTGTIKRLDSQIKDLKYNTSMTGEQVADLQTKMLNWSTIGRKGAMNMAKMIAGVGDSSKLTGDQIAKMGASLMRVGSTGKVTYYALSRVTKSAPTFMTQLAKGAGMSESKLKSLLRSGKVTQAQFQKWMAAAGKYSNVAFKGYGKTQGAALKRMKDAWSSLKGTMMKPIFNAKTSGLQALSKLMTSKELQRGAKAIGEGISQAIGYIYKHRKDVTGIAKDFVSIAVTLGKSIWKDFAAIFTDIAKSFGLVSGNSKKSVSPLHSVRQAMDGLAKNKGAIKLIAHAIEIMAIAKLANTANGLLHITSIAKGGASAVVGLAKGFKGVDDVSKLHGIEKWSAKTAQGISKLSGKVKDGLGNAWDKSLIHWQNAKDKMSDGFKALGKNAKDLAGKIGDFFKDLPNKARSAATKIKDAFGKAKTGISDALSGKSFDGAFQSLKSAGGFSNLSTAGKLATGAAGVGVAVDSAASIVKGIKDKLGSRKQFEDIGAGAGSAIGGGIGMFFGGPAGAAIGSQIGKAVGKWGGSAVKSFTNGWKAKKPPKKFWSLENLGYSAHNMWKGFTKGVSQTVNWFKKNWKEIGLYFVSPIAGGINSLYKHNPKFRKWANGLVKGFKNAWKGITKWFSNLGKGTQRAWHGMTKWFSKLGHNMAKGLTNAWKGIVKFFSNVHRGITIVWHGMTSWFSNLGRGMAKGLTGAWHGVVGFFQSIGKGIRNVFDSIKSAFDKILSPVINSVKGFGSNVGKFFSGKLKVGSLHLATGTDWKRKYPILATLNDGHDSPETGNREGILHQNGAVELVNGINVKRWLLPTDEVINASDMAHMFGSALHLARGTISVTPNKELAELIAAQTQVLKVIGSSAETKSGSVNNSNISVKKFKIGKEATKTVKDLKGKGNFSKQISKMTKKSSKDVKKFTNSFDQSQKKMSDNSSKNMKKFTDNFSKTWKKNWKDASEVHDKWNSSSLKSQKTFNGKFEDGFKSLDRGTHTIYKKFWSVMHSTARSGLNTVIGVLNGGISRVDSVVGQFGGNRSAVRRVSKLATGTGYFSGVRRAITAPTLALLNDGHDSPETQNKETIWDKATGMVHVVQGTNVPWMLKPGQEVFNASESKALGFTHFASGTGALKPLYELAKKYWKNPTETGNSLYGAVVGLTGAVNQIAKGMRNTGRSQSTEFWTQLWTMVKNKIENGTGSAKGLLKAVEKYGEGHRYVWGAAGPNTFDCSGLVMYALKKAFGINFPHFSGSQYARTQHIPKSAARMGDLVFWGAGGSDHVGVYAGGNRYFSAESPSMGIHMNTLSSVVGKGRPLFGRIRRLKQDSDDKVKVKANTALQKFVKAKVGEGFWKTIQKLEDEFGTAGQYGNPAGDGVARWRPYVIKALKANGFSAAPYQVRAWMRVIARESGGNPHAVNNWDSNARAGIPSKGLVQTIEPTFRANAFKGHHNIFNGYDDLLAGIHYMASKYGRGASAFARVSGPEGYANGGIATAPSIFGEAGPEMAIPLSAVKSSRAYELLGKTIAILSAQNGGSSAEIQKLKDEQKAEQERWDKIFDLLQQLVINSSSPETIQTKVDIDGQTAWRAMSKYYKRDAKQKIIYGRKGFSNGI